MQQEPHDRRRRLVPRWRQFSKTPSAELVPSSARQQVQGVDPSIAVLEQQWQTTKSLEDAVDLVNASIVLGRTEIAVKAAIQVVDHTTAAPAVREAAARFLEEYSPPPPHQHVREDRRDLLFKRIASVRAKLRDEPRNSILQVELARLHSASGQNERALHHLRIANGLSGRNRYVLRSYARQLIHCDRAPEAHRLLKNVDERDPWLLASRLSAAQLTGITPRTIRRELELLDSGLPPNQISELAAAVATLELDSGNLKRTRKFLRTAQQAPNDNSVAQIRWISKVCSWSFDEKLLATPLSYEAKTKHLIAEKKFSEAIDPCREWLDDEPFSTNPALAGSFIAAEHLRNFRIAYDFAEAGVRANPENSGLLNNLAFIEAMLGKIDAARRHLHLASALSSEPTDKPIFTATEGCLQFRTGDSEGGRERYLAAVRAAMAIGNRELALRAIGHALSEQLEATPEIATPLAFMAIPFLRQTKSTLETKLILDQWLKVALAANVSDLAPQHLPPDLQTWIAELLSSLQSQGKP